MLHPYILQSVGGDKGKASLAERVWVFITVDQARVNFLETRTMSIMIPPGNNGVSSRDDLNTILGKVEGTTIFLAFIS